MKPKTDVLKPTPRLTAAEPVQSELGAMRAQREQLYPAGYGAVAFHADNSGQAVDDARAAIVAMTVIQETGGTPLSTAETVAFVEQPIYLGTPSRAPKPKAGPWSRDTQYDPSFLRRKGLFQKLVRLPRLRVGSGKIDLAYISKLAEKLSADGHPDRDLLRLMFDSPRSFNLVKAESYGEPVSMRELRKARALLVRRGLWPNS